MHDKSKVTRSAAAVLIAKIGVGGGLDQWTELVPGLIKSFYAKEDIHLQEAVLQAMGYLAEDADCADQLQAYAVKMLKMVTGSMDKGNSHVRLEALKCLLNWLPMVDANMGKSAERNIIMQIICSCAASDTGPHAQEGERDDAVERLKVHGLIGIALAIKLYYEHMADYMKHVILLTKSIICKAEHSDAVRKQAVEVWCTAAEAEQELLVRKQKPCGFVNKARPDLTPSLLKALSEVKESDYDDDYQEQWTYRKTCAVCLQLFVAVYKKDKFGLEQFDAAGRVGRAWTNRKLDRETGWRTDTVHLFHTQLRTGERSTRRRVELHWTVE